MNKKFVNEEIVEILLKILYVVVSIILILIGITSFFMTAKMSTTYYIDTEGIEFVIDNLIINIIGVIFLSLGIYLYVKLIKKVPEKIVLIVCLTIIFLVGVFFIMYMDDKVPIRADQEKIFYIAKQFSENNFSALKSDQYLGMYPYQIGIVSLIEMFYKIFSSNTIFILRFINVISIVGITYFLYKITDLLFKSELSNKIVLLLTFLFIPLMRYDYIRIWQYTRSSTKLNCYL